MSRTLSEWLQYIEAGHDKVIDLGLDRMKEMIQRMDLFFECPIFVVGGTNGKGSTCAYIARTLMEEGYKVCEHTSPHIVRFNERARINGRLASDISLCNHFEIVEKARKDLSLSYFEFTLLAILSLFKEEKPDAMVLEIGLGGRLDAVNSLDPSVSVVTNIGIDHTAYLGNTREEIGYEKACIYRSGKPAVCADFDPPKSLTDYAKKIGAQLQLIGKDFSYENKGTSWIFRGKQKTYEQLPLPAMPGEFQLSNASAAFQALLDMQDIVPVKRKSLEAALTETQVEGRFWKISNEPEIILDVGHNPHAATQLAKTLKEEMIKGRTIAVCGMLKDKDRKSVCEIMSKEVDFWCLSDLPSDRGGRASTLRDFLVDSGVEQEKIQTFQKVSEAIEKAKTVARDTDRIIIFGSFLTVAAAIEFLGLSVN